MKELLQIIAVLKGQQPWLTIKGFKMDQIHQLSVLF